MNLEQLISQFRTDADDRAVPYLCSDEDVTRWLNEAEQEACIRASLLHEAADADVCEIAVIAGSGLYPVHPSVLEITNLTFTPTGSTRETTLFLTDRLELDRLQPGWRRITREPREAVHNDTKIQLDCIPATGGLLRLECTRLPLADMTGDADEPEIGPVHHRHLVYWALHRAYGMPDAELQNPNGEQKALDRFIKVFGLRPDADLRRSSRANRPQHNQAYW